MFFFAMIYHFTCICEDHTIGMVILSHIVLKERTFKNDLLLFERLEAIYGSFGLLEDILDQHVFVDFKKQVCPLSPKKENKHTHITQPSTPILNGWWCATKVKVHFLGNSLAGNVCREGSARLVTIPLYLTDGCAGNEFRSVHVSCGGLFIRHPRW